MATPHNEAKKGDIAKTVKSLKQEHKQDKEEQ